MTVRKANGVPVESAFPYTVAAPGLAASDRARLAQLDHSPRNGRLTPLEIVQGMLQSPHQRVIGKMFSSTSPEYTKSMTDVFSLLPPTQQAALMPVVSHEKMGLLTASLQPTSIASGYRDFAYLFKEMQRIDGGARFCGYMLYSIQKTHPGADDRIINDIPSNLGFRSGGPESRAYFGACHLFSKQLKAQEAHGLQSVVHYPSAQAAIAHATATYLPLREASMQTQMDYGFFFPMSEGLTILVMKDSSGHRYGITLPDAIGYDGKYLAYSDMREGQSPPSATEALAARAEELEKESKEESKRSLRERTFQEGDPILHQEITQELMDSRSPFGLQCLGYMRAEQGTVEGHRAAITIFKEVLRRDPSRIHLYTVLTQLYEDPILAQ